MSDFEPELIDLIEHVLETRLRDFNAPRLAVVTQYDVARRRVDVLPLVGTAFVDRMSREVTWSAPSEIRGVPLATPGTRRGSLTLNLRAGDRVMLLPVMHSLDDLIDSDTSTPVTPVDPRQQSLLDCVAIPVDWTDAAVGGDTFDAVLTGETAIGDPALAEPLVTRSEFRAHVALYNTHVHGSAGTPPTPAGRDPNTAPGTSALKAS